MTRTRSSRRVTLAHALASSHDRAFVPFMLYVTLRRGLAGKQQTYLQTLKALGLRKPRQEIEVANTASVRGQIEKVKHLVSVETAPQRAARIAAQEAKHAYREPIVFKHSEL